MEIREMIKTTIGFGGKWENDFKYRIDPLTYGYLVPIERIEIEFGGILMTSSSLTNTEWWHLMMPAMAIPKHIEYDPEEVEDGFLELSAGRLHLLEDADFLEHHFTRLYTFLSRAMSMIERTNEVLQMGIGLDIQETCVKLQARLVTDQELLVRNCEAFKKLFAKITDIHGKVDTAVLTEPGSFQGNDIEDIIQESRFYALIEATRLESLDILNYIMAKKKGTVEDNDYILPADKMLYKLHPNRIEAYRSGNYMGRTGFDKGIKQIQQFFATTLGGGRW